MLVSAGGDLWFFDDAENWGPHGVLRPRPRVSKRSGWVPVAQIYQVTDLLDSMAVELKDPWGRLFPGESAVAIGVRPMPLVARRSKTISIFASEGDSGFAPESDCG